MAAIFKILFFLAIARKVLFALKVMRVQVQRIGLIEVVILVVFVSLYLDYFGLKGQKSVISTIHVILLFCKICFQSREMLHLKLSQNVPNNIIKKITHEFMDIPYSF